MYRRALICSLLAVLTIGVGGCHNKKVQNPIADVNSKQPDKVLFDRAMDAMKHNKFDVARMSLQTLINTYPDSEFVARAKLAVGDSWYAEGNTAALAQAEAEYKDFITFFPNMPEAAEAQMKIANIHYEQMEKPDRDFTHAKRAEDEYREMIKQYPDSKLVPQAKERLRQVQEVLADREFMVGRFYYLRESWPAAIARLKTLADTYPLYSSSDEALFLLGDAYEHEVQITKASKLPPDIAARLIKDQSDKAAAAYSRLITRYPVTDRVDEARKRLQAMHRPVPRPTADAIAQNKAEEESREKLGIFGRAWTNFHKRPDLAQAAKVGEPTLVDPKQTSAAEIVKNTISMATAKTGTNTVSVETVGSGAPAPSEPTPRSDTTPANPPANPNDPNAIPELTPMSSGTTTPATNGQDATSGTPAPAPPQVNEAGTGSTDPSATAQSDTTTTAPDKSESSSKAKKKKGLRKLVPF